MTRREFLGSLTACGALGGCRNPWWFGESPRLRFGVISDLHVTTPESTERFRRALAYFRDRRADAVIVAGDLSDWGLRSGLKYVAATWYDVFPDDRGADGDRVEKLFVTGNHDFGGWGYGDMTLDMHLHGYSEGDALVNFDMAKCWEDAFHEPYSEIRRRSVRGFDFISAEWRGHEKSENDRLTANWLRAHEPELKRGKPFFFFRHAPLPGTVSSSIGRPGDANLTDALRGFPDCVAFTGHTHWTLNDERSIWQEEFTAISVPSLSYTSLPRGYENGHGRRDGASGLGMTRLQTRERLETPQGFFVSVFSDRIVVERRDFQRMTEAAEPWVIPMGESRDRPYALGLRENAMPVPEFPPAGVVDVGVVNGDTRDGKATIFVRLDFPSACFGRGRVFDYEVSTLLDDGRIHSVKCYLSPGFHGLREEERDSVSFLFDGCDVPENDRFRFVVKPRNSFGKAGQPLCSRPFSCFPGKMGFDRKKVDLDRYYDLMKDGSGGGA